MEKQHLRICKCAWEAIMCLNAKPEHLDAGHLQQLRTKTAVGIINRTGLQRQFISY